MQERWIFSSKKEKKKRKETRILYLSKNIYISALINFLVSDFRNSSTVAKFRSMFHDEKKRNECDLTLRYIYFNRKKGIKSRKTSVTTLLNTILASSPIYDVCRAWKILLSASIAFYLYFELAIISINFPASKILCRINWKPEFLDPNMKNSLNVPYIW